MLPGSTYTAYQSVTSTKYSDTHSLRLYMDVISQHDVKVVEMRTKEGIYDVYI